MHDDIRPIGLAAVGRVFFGLPMVAFGVVHLLYGDFVTRFAPGWPSWAPGRSILARVVGALLIAAGLLIVFEKGARMAALSVATMIALSLVPVCSEDSANPGHGGTWTVPAIAGGVGLWIRQTVRLAALLSGTMIFIWFLIVHIRRAAADTGNMMGWSGVFESLAISGIAFLVASTSQALGGMTTALGQGDELSGPTRSTDYVAAGRRERTAGTGGATPGRRDHFALHALDRPITSRSIAVGGRNRT